MVRRLEEASHNSRQLSQSDVQSYDFSFLDELEKSETSAVTVRQVGDSIDSQKIKKPLRKASGWKSGFLSRKPLSAKSQTEHMEGTQLPQNLPKSDFKPAKEGSALRESFPSVSDFKSRPLQDSVTERSAVPTNPRPIKAKGALNSTFKRRSDREHD